MAVYDYCRAAIQIFLLGLETVVADGHRLPAGEIQIFLLGLETGDSEHGKAYRLAAIQIFLLGLETTVRQSRSARYRRFKYSF